jgi:hypothetical protein
MIKKSHQRIIDQIFKKLNKNKTAEKIIIKFKKEIDKIFFKRHFIYIKLKELFKTIPTREKTAEEKEMSYYQLNKEKCRQQAIKYYYDNINYYRMYNNLYNRIKYNYHYDANTDLQIKRNVKVVF